MTQSSWTSLNQRLLSAYNFCEVLAYAASAGLLFGYRHVWVCGHQPFLLSGNCVLVTVQHGIWQLVAGIYDLKISVSHCSLLSGLSQPQADVLELLLSNQLFQMCLLEDLVQVIWSTITINESFVFLTHTKKSPNMTVLL